MFERMVELGVMRGGVAIVAGSVIRHGAVSCAKTQQGTHTWDINTGRQWITSWCSCTPLKQLFVNTLEHEMVNTEHQDVNTLEYHELNTQ